MNPIKQARRLGQAFWLDNLTRRLVREGDLKRRISEHAITGVTSNPAIFHQAIGSSDEYDDDIRRLVHEGRTIPEIYESLVVDDVQRACDLLRPVFLESDGTDGFVSLEVPPRLSQVGPDTLAEVKRLWSLVDRPNVMIKIPGTSSALPVLESAVHLGINTNITLLFSPERFRKFLEAFMAGQEKRLSEGQSVRPVASVASFFVSRVDTRVDSLLGLRWAQSADMNHRIRLARLFGKSGVANARLAYREFLDARRSTRWQSLERRGARAPRLVWASTSQKDPLLSPLLYAESLLGPETIITATEKTLDLFAARGRVRIGLDEKGLAEAAAVVRELEEVGIDLAAVSDDLQQEGIKKFIEPFDRLMLALCEKRAQFIGKKANVQDVGQVRLVNPALTALSARRFSERLFARDGSLWASDLESVKKVENGLGWVDSHNQFRARVDEIREFADGVRRDGFKHVVILGTGSNTAPAQIASGTFGSTRGWPDILVLDNTDPAAIRGVESQIDVAKTFFLVVGKSGTNLETSSLYKYFYDRLLLLGLPALGTRFAAITDSQSWLAREAVAKKFRQSYLNPPNLTSPFAALSYLGLVPMAMLGLDIQAVLDRARSFAISAGPGVPEPNNAALQLGASLALLAKNGRDKLTFVLSPNISGFAEWAEHLLVHTTSKEGTGIVPVVGEALGTPRAYGNDRLFLHMIHRGSAKRSEAKRVAVLEKAGHPVIRIALPDRMGLAEEYVRWQLASVCAGLLLGVNPFGDPSEGEGRKSTEDLLRHWATDRRFPKEKPAAETGSVRAYGPVARKAGSVDAAVSDFLRETPKNGFIGILAFFRRTAARDRALADFRAALADRFGVATTLAHGPRFLHTTAPLYKCGPENGSALMLTTEEDRDLPIPGHDYGFGVLHEAQALGELQAIRNRGRRVLRLHFKGDIKDALGSISGKLK